MKRLLFVVIMAVMAGLHAQGGVVKRKVARGVNLEVVYERNFEEPVIDVIFDTATVTIEEARRMGWKEEAFTEDEVKGGKVLVSYPKVVLISRGRELSWLPDARRNSYYAKEIRFYDKNGKIKKRLFLKKNGEEKIYYSPKKRYVLVSRRPTEWAPGYTGGVLYDLNGEKIWELNGPTPIAVSDEGYSVACYLDWQIPPATGGDFYIYDSKAKLIATIKNPLKKRTAPLFAKFSRDGNFVILGFINEEDYPAVFELIEKNGRIKWKYEFSEYRFSRTCGEVHVIPYVGVIGTIYKGKGSSKIFSLSWNGNLKWIKPLNNSIYMGCMLSHNTKKVYTWTLSGDLRCFDENTGNTLWKYEGTYRWIEMFEQKYHLIVRGYPNKIFLFDNRTGEVEMETEYPAENIFMSMHSGRLFIVEVKDRSILGLKLEGE